MSDRNCVTHHYACDCIEAERTAETKALREALAETKALREALADAIRRPMGVIPDSANGLLSTAELDAAENRRLVSGMSPNT